MDDINNRARLEQSYEVDNHARYKTKITAEIRKYQGEDPELTNLTISTLRASGIHYIHSF